MNIKCVEASDWFYRHDNQDKGPVPFSSLKDLAQAGQLAPADLVKQRGAMHWSRAGDVPELFPRGDDDTTTTPPTPASTG